MPPKFETKQSMKTSIIITGLVALSWSAQLDCRADPTRVDPDQLAGVVFQNLTNACPKIDPAKLLNRSFYIAHQVVGSATNFLTLEDGLKKVFSGSDQNLAILDYKNNTEALS